MSKCLHDFRSSGSSKFWKTLSDEDLTGWAEAAPVSHLSFFPHHEYYCERVCVFKTSFILTQQKGMGQLLDDYKPIGQLSRTKWKKKTLQYIKWSESINNSLFSAIHFYLYLNKSPFNLKLNKSHFKHFTGNYWWKRLKGPNNIQCFIFER